MYEFFSSTRWKDIRETLDGGSYVWRMVGEEETADLRPEVLFPALAAKVLAKMLRSNLAWGFKHFQNNIFNPKPHYWANLSIFQWMRSSIMWSDNWLSVVSNFKQSNFKNGFSLLNCHEFGSCEGSGALQVKILIYEVDSLPCLQIYFVCFAWVQCGESFTHVDWLPFQH